MSSVPVLISVRDGEIVIDIHEPQMLINARDARRIADALREAADQLDQPESPAGESVAEVPEETAGRSAARSDESGDEADQPEFVYSADPGDALAPTPAVLAYQTSSPADAVTPPLFKRGSSGVRFSRKVSDFMDAHSIDREDIIEVVSDPDETWEGMNPGAIDRPTMAIRSDTNHGAIYYTDSDGCWYVISVQPRFRLEEQRKQLDGGPRRISGGPKRSAIDSLAELISRSEAQGLAFEQGKGHGKIYDPSRPQDGHYTVPLTPSDHRAYLNAAAEIRRLFNVDL